MTSIRFFVNLILVLVGSTQSHAKLNAELLAAASRDMGIMAENHLTQLTQLS